MAFIHYILVYTIIPIRPPAHSSRERNILVPGAPSSSCFVWAPETFPPRSFWFQKTREIHFIASSTLAAISCWKYSRKYLQENQQLILYKQSLGYEVISAGGIQKGKEGEGGNNWIDKWWEKGEERVPLWFRDSALFNSTNVQLFRRGKYHGGAPIHVILRVIVKVVWVIIETSMMVKYISQRLKEIVHGQVMWSGFIKQVGATTDHSIHHST